MTALVLLEPFFAPVDRDAVGSLLEQYQHARMRIDHIANFIDSEWRGAVQYFLDGNVGRDRHVPGVKDLFAHAGAIAALNADYWRRALELTDVLSCMPEARRNDWFTAIKDRKTPEFSEDAVYPTLENLLLSRAQYFAERVDGVFRGLSHTHLTNSPTGFRRRMILNYVYNYGSANTHKSGIINDLRCIIAKFSGRDEPKWNVTSGDLNRLRRTPGKWVELDGGALRIRVYTGVCTAHLEINDDLAIRLNWVLASLYPGAIAHKDRTPQAKPRKSFSVLSRPLPFEVLHILREMRRERAQPNDGVFRYSYGYATRDNEAAMEETVHILQSIGGVSDGPDHFQFDFDPEQVLDEIVLRGTVPDRRSFQFYPTPASIAERAIQEAQILDSHRCLEPSAGQGGLADQMPKARTTCVELSALHCQVLKAKGCDVIQADFLEWAPQHTEKYQRVVMNPPFTQGQWQLHLTAAAGLLTTDGRLVAVVPASARGKSLLPGFLHEWSEPIAGEFQHTSISVVLLTLTRKNMT
jgi:hypothetical protein